jgi:hypothetical protein
MNRSVSVLSRSFSLRGSGLLRGLLLALGTLSLTSCATRYYKLPTNNFAGRPIPPSLLEQRVLVGVTANGTTGLLQILDGLRDLRSNIQFTKPTFSISGFSSGFPNLILNFPEQSRGYAYSNSDGSLTNINYGTEAASGSAAMLPFPSAAIAIPPTFTRIYSAEPSGGILALIDNATGTAYALNLPNVYQVVANSGDTVALAFVRNSNSVYRIFKLNTTQFQFQTAIQAIQATGATDCQPLNLPVYCVVPVPGNYNHPSNAYFSLDGTTAYILNSGPEVGGPTATAGTQPNAATAASVSVIPQSQLVNTLYVGSPQAPAGYQTSPITATSPVTKQILVPGGVTTAISDGTTLYLSGQSPYVVAANGTTTTGTNPASGSSSNPLFAGYMTTINQATNTVSAAYSISDGSHFQMLFADDNTLWIAANQCANGVRQNLFAHQGNTSQAANYNCLTMFNTSTLTPQIVPAVNQAGNGVAAVPTLYPNTYQADPYYYGDMGAPAGTGNGGSGIAWVQNYHKIYTAYGGQIHSFNTTDGSERDNTNITVQGTVLTVVYMDALTNAAN